MKFTTEILKDLDGDYQVGFTIGNQTFYLSSYGLDDSEEESKKMAQWQEELLRIALNNLSK